MSKTNADRTSWNEVLSHDQINWRVNDEWYTDWSYRGDSRDTNDENRTQVWMTMSTKKENDWRRLGDRMNDRARTRSDWFVPHSGDDEHKHSTWAVPQDSTNHYSTAVYGLKPGMCALISDEEWETNEEEQSTLRENAQPVWQIAVSRTRRRFVKCEDLTSIKPGSETNLCGVWDCKQSKRQTFLF